MKVCLCVHLCAQEPGFPLEERPRYACDYRPVCLDEYLSVCLCLIPWYLHVTRCVWHPCVSGNSCMFVYLYVPVNVPENPSLHVIMRFCEFPECVLECGCVQGLLALCPPQLHSLLPEQADTCSLSTGTPPPTWQGQGRTRRQRQIWRQRQRLGGR